MYYLNFVKLSIYFALAASGMAAEKSPDPLDVYANNWQPYVNPTDAGPGLTTAIVSQVLTEAGRTPRFRYLDYGLIYKLLRRGDISAAYPFFKTSERQKEVLFSVAMHSIENRIYYNHYLQGARSWKDIEGKTGSLSGVKGYAYGENIIDPLVDKADLINSEVLALRALIRGEIDYLPMEKEVKDILMHRYFPEHIYKIRALEHEEGGFVGESAPLHVIFPMNESGIILRDQFNEAYKKLEKADAFEEIEYSKLPQNSFYINLVTTDNIPFIIGYDSIKSDNPDRKIYAIPSGTRGIVLEWSETILKAFQSESVYPAMMDESLVRLVNGPHMGKELWIKNVHLEID